MSIIKIENLKKHYGDVKAVDGISLEVEKGKLFGFLGVNGAGKSTVINMLSTLVKHTSGTAEICGLTLGKDNEEIRRKIGVVYQQNNLDNLLTVEENLMCRSYLYEKNTAVNKARYREVCSILSLDDVSSRKFGKLSGGQKRRAVIASALMHTPEILFLDEPTTGLDPATRKSLWEAISTLQQTYGMTVFLTTHYMEEAANSNHIVIIDKGKIVTQGTPYELKEKFAKDTLKLYSDNHEILFNALNGYDFSQDSKYVSVHLDNTIDAIKILDKAKQFITGFEVIQGSMDDVFLNACGKNLNAAAEMEVL